MNRTLGIYLHVPYCLRKCRYCDFNSYPLEGQGSGRLDRFLGSVKRESELRAGDPEIASAQARTLYMGGGTPTILSGRQLADLIGAVRGAFDLKPGAEVTIEANPGTIDREKLIELREAGVNRISLGVQSLSDRLLKFLGRIHTARESLRAIELVREAGFHNLNLDLIFAIPGQTVEDWRTTLELALQADPQHLSLYSLSIEPGTQFYEMCQQGELEPTEEELELAMFQQAIEMLCAAGYQHYEISNFAQNGYRCQHSQRYWRNGEYLGLGPGAHSFWGGVRWRNIDSPERYCHLLESGILPVVAAERLSRRQQMGETLILGLRMLEGVSRERFARIFGEGLESVYGEEIDQLEQENLVELIGDRLRLTSAGLPLGNEVFVQLV